MDHTCKRITDQTDQIKKLKQKTQSASKFKHLRIRFCSVRKYRVGSRESRAEAPPRPKSLLGFLGGFERMKAWKPLCLYLVAKDVNLLSCPRTGALTNWAPLLAHKALIRTYIRTGAKWVQLKFPTSPILYSRQIG